MHIELTEKEFISTLDHMTVGEILEFLMSEGLTLKIDKRDFSDVPDGIYKRRDGEDLISYHRNGDEFYWVYKYGLDHPVDEIPWTLSLGGGGWWIQVLDKACNPVQNGFSFKVNDKGERLA